MSVPAAFGPATVDQRTNTRWTQTAARLSTTTPETQISRFPPLLAPESPRFGLPGHVPHAAGPEQKSWLDSALEELDEIARGIEVDGPKPDAEVVAAARKSLRNLSELVASPPAVDDDGTGGIGIEFAGKERDRILFIIETPQSFAYYELIGGRSTRARSTNWKDLMTAIGVSGIQRAGISVPPRTFSPSIGAWVPIRDDAFEVLPSPRRHH